MFFLHLANRVTLPEIYATLNLPRCVVELIFLIDNACHRVSSRCSCCNESFGAEMLRDRSRSFFPACCESSMSRIRMNFSFFFFSNEFQFITRRESVIYYGERIKN